MSQFGGIVKQKQLDDIFLSTPGEDIVAKTIMQLQKVQGNKDKNGKVTYPFQMLFGPYTPEKPCRWADYQRFDWSTRMLPAINIFEGQVLEKQSDNAYLTGNISFQVYWPGSARRSDLMRLQNAFSGILTNFFNSDYVKAMLDELYYIQRDAKVYGLNEYGKLSTWTPNTEGVTEEGELVPVTVVDVKYRIDLRSWYRALEFQNRTKEEPFRETLDDLSVIGGEYDGVTKKKDVVDADTIVKVEDEFEVSNP